MWRSVAVALGLGHLLLADAHGAGPVGDPLKAETPWWLVAGVKPMGPRVNMGSYTVTTFSEAQQEEFGVDAHGRIKHWTRFWRLGEAMTPCIGPGEKQEGLDQAHFVQLLGHTLSVGWRRAQLEDPDLQTAMGHRSSCQRSCMVKVIGASLRTLWSLGELVTPKGKDSFSKSVADAIRACYPTFQAMNIDSIAEKVSLYVGEELQKTAPDIAEAGGFAPRSLQSDVEPCLEESADGGKRQDFVKRMEKAVQDAVMEVRSRSWRALMHDARPCQRGCHDEVLRASVETLWDSGILSLGNSDALTHTALQGALASCFPNLDEASGSELAGEALVRFQRPPHEVPSLYGDCTREQRCTGTGVQCYAQNKFYAQCLHACPEHWECDVRRLAEMPILA